jgi:hypothetical protein
MKFESHIADAALNSFDVLETNCKQAAFIAAAVADPTQAALRSERCKRDEYYDIAFNSGVLNGLAIVLGSPIKEFVAAMEGPEQVEMSRFAVMALARAAKAREQG